MALLESPMFLIFGGGAIIAIVAILTDYLHKREELRAKERERSRRHEQEIERRLLGLDGSDAVEGISLRLQALERDVAEIKALLKPSAEPSPIRTINPPVTHSADTHAEPDLLSLQ